MPRETDHVGHCVPPNEFETTGFTTRTRLNLSRGESFAFIDTVASALVAL